MLVNQYSHEPAAQSIRSRIVDSTHNAEPGSYSELDAVKMVTWQTPTNRLHRRAQTGRLGSWTAGRFISHPTAFPVAPLSRTELGRSATRCSYGTPARRASSATMYNLDLIGRLGRTAGTSTCSMAIAAARSSGRTMDGRSRHQLRKCVAAATALRHHSGQSGSTRGEESFVAPNGVDFVEPSPCGWTICGYLPLTEKGIPTIGDDWTPWEFQGRSFKVAPYLVHAVERTKQGWRFVGESAARPTRPLPTEPLTNWHTYTGSNRSFRLSPCDKAAFERTESGWVPAVASVISSQCLPEWPRKAAEPPGPEWTPWAGDGRSFMLSPDREDAAELTDDGWLWANAYAVWTRCKRLTDFANFSPGPDWSEYQYEGRRIMVSPKHIALERVGTRWRFVRSWEIEEYGTKIVAQLGRNFSVRKLGPFPSGTRFWDVEGVPVAEVPSPEGGVATQAFDSPEPHWVPPDSVYRDGTRVDELTFRRNVVGKATEEDSP